MRPRLDAGEYGWCYESPRPGGPASMRPRLDAGEYRKNKELLGEIKRLASMRPRLDAGEYRISNYPGTNIRMLQ